MVIPLAWIIGIFLVMYGIRFLFVHNTKQKGDEIRRVLNIASILVVMAIVGFLLLIPAVFIWLFVFAD